MNTGAPHASSVRQLITPLPYSPPMMNAAFLSSGITAAQRARAQYSSGMVGRSACTTFAAVVSRNASLAEMAPLALEVAATRTIAAKANFFMEHLCRAWCNAAAISSEHASPEESGPPQESRAILSGAQSQRNQECRRRRTGHARARRRDGWR